MWTDLAEWFSNGAAALLMAFQATQQGASSQGTQPITVERAATAAIGLIFGGLVTYLFHWAREQSRDLTQNAIAFFEELHGPTMLKARFDAAKTIKNLSPMNIQQLYEYFEKRTRWSSICRFRWCSTFLRKCKCLSSINRSTRRWHGSS